MKRTREQAMKAEQAERALRQSEQFEKLLGLSAYLENLDIEANETIDQLERA